MRNTGSTMGPMRAHTGSARPACLFRGLLFSLSLLAAGCELPGQPNPADRPVPADQVFFFAVLYDTRCAGCHGAEGRLGPAPPLSDPVFRIIVPDAELLRVVREGRAVSPGQKSPMPAFAQDRGGPLTEDQVTILAEGIKGAWGGAWGRMPPLEVLRDQRLGIKGAWGEGWGRPASELLPPYLSPTGGKGGDKEAGARLFDRACAGCHGPDGHGEKDGRPLRGGAINNQAFLALISDQALRRTIITGRPDLGMPAYDGTAGRPPDFQALTSAEIDDLVALLRSWRQGSVEVASGE